MNIRAWMIVAAMIVAGAWAASVNAQGVAFAVVDGPYPDAELHQLDLVTGALTPVGAIGHRVTHLAFDPSWTLYGLGLEPNDLITIDVMTGLGTVIGPLAVGVTNVRGLAFTNDGRLWMAARDDALGPSLYEIDPGTGSATRFVGLDEEYFGSLAGNGSTLYMASYSLAEIDPSTGVVTPLSSSHFGMWTARAIDVDDLGTLWGLMLCGPCMGPLDILTVRTIDPTDGTLEDDGPYEPHGTWGLAVLHGGLFFDGFESGTTSAWSVAP